MELFWAFFLAAVALLADYLGLTHGHVWLAWAAALLFWSALYVLSGRVIHKHKGVSCILCGAGVFGATLWLLNAGPHTQAKEGPTFTESGEYSASIGSNVLPLVPGVRTVLLGKTPGGFEMGVGHDPLAEAVLVKGRILISARLWGGASGPVEIVRNRIKLTNQLWDRNYNDTAMEFVNEKQEPMLQVIRTTPYNMTVYGVFEATDGEAIVASPAGLAGYVPMQDPKFHLTRMFKYPSRLFPRQELTQPSSPSEP